MHKKMYREYEKIVAGLDFTGSVLEVGAVPGKRTLLCMRQLAGASEKVGINLNGPHEYEGFKIVRGNANAMPEFADDRFDMVLCNAMIEHDPKFWKTISEIKRVTKPGGLVVIGAPGYRVTWVDKLQKGLRRVPVLNLFKNSAQLSLLFAGTFTYQIHDAPGDYYRFSPQAFREVILGGLDDVRIWSVMMPPRLIGIGRKPVSAPSN
jgi:SAM-dependent methyltransferase